MTTTVTVPGASGTAIPNPYSTPQNLAVAQQIADLLYTALGNGMLYVQYSDRNPGPVPPGDVGELAVTLPGASNIVVPAGYSFTSIDQSVTGPLTVSGGGSLFVGDANTTYWGAPSPNPVYIAAGDGNDLISLPTGSTYTAALGNGNDTINANGSGTVTGGSGSNLFFVGGSPGDQNLISSYGNNDTIVAGAGSATVGSYGADPLIYGGSGQLVYFGNAAGNPTIAGGTGNETVFASAGQNITYQDGSNTTQGANLMDAGAGNETLNAGGAQYGVHLAAGVGSVLMIGSHGNDIFYGGSGAATMTGNGGSDTFIFGNIPGFTGGTDIITDFSSSDVFELSGYGANAAQTALNDATVANGNTTVKLSDNTTITFLNVSNPATIHNQSF
jgi:Ca2+-binding RTX toxin-like protein